MLRSKKEVDKHVQDLLRKSGSEQERNLRGYSIAKLYYQVGEYRTAKQYISGYLNEKETSAPGHRLAGQISEGLGEKEAAVRSYRVSFDLDNNQRDLVLKVCQLLCEMPVTSSNQERERFWLDCADKLQLKHSSVLALRQRVLFSSKQDGGQDMENLLTNQMLAHPTDSNLRIQLLKIYLERGRSDEAFEHASKVEALRPFPNDMTWYTCVIDIHEAYRSSKKTLNADFYTSYLTSLERLAFLKISKVANNSRLQNDALPLLRRMDSVLHEASTGKSQDESILDHFSGQLYFYMGLSALMSGEGKQEVGSQSSSTPSALFAAAFAQPLAQSQLNHSENLKRQISILASDGAYRKSQAGHYLLSLEGQVGRETAVDSIRYFDNPDGRGLLYTSVFGSNAEELEKSYFLENFKLPPAENLLPSFEDLSSYDAKTLSSQLGNLNNIVWLGLRYLEHYDLEKPSNGSTDAASKVFAYKFGHILRECDYFSDLPFSVSSWNSSAPETLSFLDVEAFLFAAVYCATKQEAGSAESSDKGTVFPVLLSKVPCSEQQTTFWDAVYKAVSKTSRENFGEMRRVIQRGLEVVRLTGNNHNVPRQLVARLARCFVALASLGRPYPPLDLSTPVSTHEFNLLQVEALETQACRYWKAYLSLDKHYRISGSPLKFFDYPVKPGINEDAVEEARLYQGYCTWRQGKKEEAIKFLEHQVSPYASYYVGLIYKDLAEQQLRKEASGSEIVSSLLNKAKDSFYLTLDRLRSPSVERSHPLNKKLGSVIEEVESKIASLSEQSDQKNGNTLDDATDEYPYLRTPRTRQNLSTPFATPASSRVEARPSPERLDAQLRQLVARQEAFSQTISNELQEIHSEVSGIKSEVQKVQEIRSEVTGIKAMIQKVYELLEQHQQQQQRKPRGAKTSESYEDYYDEEEEGDWQDNEEEEEAEEEEIPQPQPPVGRKGKLKSAAAANLPTPGAYPPFALPFPAHGYLPNFAAAGYGQFPGMNPYMMPGMAPPSPFPQVPYGAPHFQHSPAPPAHPMPAVAPAPAPVAAPATPQQQGSVFSRLGVKATPQQVTTTTPALPQNVVITSSDALPPAAPLVTSTPQYAVTIPPQHRAGAAPHAFQINLPTASSILSPEKKPQDAEKLEPAIPLTTQGLLASIPQPTYSSVTTTPDKGVAGVKSPVRSSNRRVSTCSESSAADEEEHDAMPDFKPIIPLPEEVEVTTGEEGEAVLFEQRSKLFRYVNNEWKERGVGNLKILHDETTNRVRVIMRRDQVFKICANHYITPEIDLIAMKTSPNAWIWAAPDFADGESRLEKFCARFKTPEQADEFAKAFNKAKSIVKQGSSTPSAASTATTATTTTSTSGFGDKFKPKAGSWTCGICYVSNDESKTVCAACETPKPGAAAAPAKTTGTTATPAASAFKFGVPGSSGSGFSLSQPPATTSSAAPAFSTGGGFKFTQPATAATVTATATTQALAAPAAGSFKFTLPPAAPTTAAAATTSSTVSFGLKPPSSTAAATTAATTTAPSTPSFSFKLPSTAASSPVTTAAATSTPSFSFKPTATAATPATTTESAPSKPVFSFTPSGTTAGAPVKSLFGGVPAQEAKPVEKPTFGGFTFAAKPVIEAPKPAEEVKKEDDKTKPSPFAGFSFSPVAPKSTTAAEPAKPASQEASKPAPFGGFSFGTPAAIKPTPAAETVKPAAEKAAGPFSSFSFGGAAGKEAESSGMLFSALAQQTGATGFTANKDFKGFAGTGQPVFAAAKPAASEKNEGEEEAEDKENVEEFEPTTEFQPVIPLPALVDVKTGEEDENALFSERAILYRFVGKEWKERGRGDFKILEHKTTGRVRFLMRREQVHKICCNHAITADLEIKPLQTSDRTWTWFANDFSEGELVKETFALKFKTEEMAKKFKGAFDAAQKKLKEKGETKEEKKPEPQPAPASTIKPLSELFKPQQGSWECQGCFIRNPADVTKCPACETRKPGTEDTEPTSTAAATTAVSSFKFGVPSASGAATPKAPAASGPFALSSGGGLGGFSFGTPSTSATKPFGSTTTATPSSGFSFGNSASATGFSFSMPVTTTPSSSPVKSGRSPHVSFSSDNEYYEDDGAGDNIHFAPVIPLPDKVEVKTGEEEEEVLYSHRAKLLRFADGEWKERGTGDVKILKHKATGKVRLLMRREQILKVCLNHALTTSLKFVAKDERSWLWAAQDFAEPEPSFEKFVIRFRNAEVAKEFMDTVQNAISGKAAAKAADDDVPIVYEKKASDELRQKAEQLQLPPNFFSYEDSPPCPGCRGCIDDEDKPAKQGEKKETPKPATVAESNLFSSWGSKADSQISFASLASTSSSGFNKPANFSWTGAGQPVFGTTSLSLKASKDVEKAEDDEEDETEEVENTHDPHFEPIVPLPALVDVKTGEEDEEVIFCHRAKLYRFEVSTKEWKERGVGDLKILFHREKNTYRILLRRDQIHKLACNHWLTADMELTPMSTSTSSWLWAAMDYSEGELVAEKFAVKFKLDETAKEFKRKFDECTAAIRGDKAIATTAVPASATPAAATPSSSTPVVAATTEPANEEEAEDEHEESEEDDEDYEDVPESVMFQNRCTLSALTSGTWVLRGTGTLKILYDDDLLCTRIVVESDLGEHFLCDTVIAIETELKVEDRECVWSALDYSDENEPEKRTFRAQFATADVAVEFSSIFHEGKEIAENSEVHDVPDSYHHGEEYSGSDNEDDH